MTIDEIRKLWDVYGEADERHDCPVERDEEFVHCEICDRSREAINKLRWATNDLVEMLLEREDAIARALVIVNKLPDRFCVPGPTPGTYRKRTETR